MGLSLFSKETEISLGTPLTTDVQTGVVSDEDISEIWEEVKRETMEKVGGNKR